MRVDIALVTFKQEEYDAVFSRLGAGSLTGDAYNRTYRLFTLQTLNGNTVKVALCKANQQGNGEAQALGHDVIADLKPGLIIAIGIAGGKPTADYTLGDVILSSYIYDLTVSEANADGSRQFDVRGGSILGELDSLLNAIHATDLPGWNTKPKIGLKRPTAHRNPVRQDGVGEEWHKKICASIASHFDANGVSSRPPKFLPGAIFSSDTLVKEPELLNLWLTTMRKGIAIEMEAAGLLRAAMAKMVPFFSIRSISDVVGLQREDAWTNYACASAAAFTHSLLKSDLLKRFYAGGPSIEGNGNPRPSEIDEHRREEARRQVVENGASPQFQPSTAAGGAAFEKWDYLRETLHKTVNTEGFGGEGISPTPLRHTEVSLQQQLLELSPADFDVATKLSESLAAFEPVYIDFHFLHDTAIGMYAFTRAIGHPKRIQEALSLRSLLQALLLSEGLTTAKSKSCRMTPMHSAELFYYVKSIIASQGQTCPMSRSHIAAEFLLALDEHKKSYWALSRSDKESLKNVQVTTSILMGRRAGPLHEFFTILQLMRGSEYSNYHRLLQHISTERLDDDSVTVSDIYACQEFDEVLRYYQDSRNQRTPALNSYNDAASLLYLANLSKRKDVFYLVEDHHIEPIKGIVKVNWPHLNIVSCSQVTLAALLGFTSDGKPRSKGSQENASVGQSDVLDVDTPRHRVTAALHDPSIWERLTNDATVKAVITDLQKGEDDEGGSLVSLFRFLSEDLARQGYGGKSPLVWLPAAHQTIKEIVDLIRLLAPADKQQTWRMMSLGLYQTVDLTSESASSSNQNTILTLIDSSHLLPLLLEHVLLIQSGQLAFVSETDFEEGSKPLRGSVQLGHFVRMSALLNSGVFYFGKLGLQTQPIRLLLFRGCMSAYYYCLMKREKPGLYLTVVTNLLWASCLLAEDYDGHEEDPAKTLTAMLEQLRVILSEYGVTVSGGKASLDCSVKIHPAASQAFACYIYGRVIQRRLERHRGANNEDKDLQKLLEWFMKNYAAFSQATVALVANIALHQVIPHDSAQHSLRSAKTMLIPDDSWREMEEWDELLSMAMQEGYFSLSFEETRFWFHVCGMLSEKPGYGRSRCEEDYKTLKDYRKLANIAQAIEAWEHYETAHNQEATPGRSPDLES